MNKWSNVKNCVQNIEDDKAFERAEAMVKLLTELNKGFASGEEKGWLSEDDLKEHFSGRRQQA